MKNRLRLLVLLLLILPASSFGQVPHRALVSVDGPAPGVAAALLEANVSVVRDMGRYLLVAAGDEDLARLSAGSAAWRVLDASMEGKTYYTVTLRDESEAEALRAMCRVLRADRFDAVIEASEAEAAAIVAAGHDVARVFVRPIRLSREAGLSKETGVMTGDPVIQGMVNAVTGSNIDATVQRLQNFVTRYCTTDSAQAAANWIKTKFQSFGITDVAFETIPGGYKPNVVATIPGVGDPSKIIVLGAHYDSYAQTNNAPGADDNASGTACVIETARILSQHQFNFTIKFVAFGAEELGLYGSEAFAANSANRGDDIQAAVCVDMIGYLAAGDVMDLDIIKNTSSQWLRNAAFQSAADYVTGFSLVDGTIPGGASSDHASFWAHGYDSILFFEDSGSYSPYIHTTSDVVGTSYNNPTLARNSVKTAVGLVATLAQPFVIGISHTPLADTEDTSNPYRVLATITAAGTLDPDSMLVRYDTGAGYQAVLMTPTGLSDEYEGYIPAQPQGTFVDYYIYAKDLSGNHATHPVNAPANVHTFFVGSMTTVFGDDLEAAHGWTVGAPGDNASTGVWVRADPVGSLVGSSLCQPEDDHTASPGVTCYVTGNAAAGAVAGTNDVDGGHTTLLSPIFDLSGYSFAFVSYWRWFSNNLGGGPGEDYWQVQVTSNGTTWVNLEYTTESNNTWAERTFAIQDYVPLTATVRFRFIATDVNLASLVEAAIDDVTITGFATPIVAAGEPGVPKKLMLAGGSPNPFHPRTQIRFYVPEPGRIVTLRIYDVSGREVRTLISNERVSGWRTAEWNGRENAGAGAASGVYFCKLDAGGQVLSRRLVLLR